MTDQALTAIVESGPLDLIIAGWLDAKFRRSQSQRTLEEYARALSVFRTGLQREGLDLDAPAAKIAMYAQAFAGFSTTGKIVAPATYNMRLNILSSFYEYARKRDVVPSNPIERLERASVQRYAGVMPLSPETVADRLQAIDRTALQGKRDYALLATLLEIGWRVSEVAQLSWKDIQLHRGRAVLTCEHAKGNEVISNTLSKASTACLLDWLHAYYGAELGKLSLDAPLFVALAPGGRNGYNRGQRLHTQAIADICKRHLGVSKVHVTRHTSAVMMEAAGMPISEIQARLNHKSLGTTSIYLQQLHRAENKYSDTIAGLLGIE